MRLARALVAALAAPAALGVLAACGGLPRPEPPAAPASAPVAVYVLADLPPGGRLAFARLAELFAREEGGRVRVELRSPADYAAAAPGAAPGAAQGAAPAGGPGAPAGGQAAGAGQAGPASEAASELPPDPVAEVVPTAARSDEAPQIAIVGEAGLAALFAQHRVDPLPGPAASEIARELLAPAARAAGADPGGPSTLLAVPLDLDVDVLYVRRGLLYQPPASWVDVTGVARRSMSGGREAGPIALGEEDAGPIVALAALAPAPQGRAGAPASPAPGAAAGLAAPGAAELAGPPGQSAVAFLRAWLAAGDFRFFADPVAAFASGEAGLALAPASRLGDLEAALGGHASFVVSRLPGLPATARLAVPLPYGPRASREAAAGFLAFLARPASQALWAIQTGRLPAVAAAYEAEAWQAYLRHHPEVAVMADAAGSAPAWAPGDLPSAAGEAARLLRKLAAQAAGKAPTIRR